MLNSRYSIYNMCGIAGIVGIESKEVIKSMCDVIRHRGPDDCGYYIDKNISLGHRRLSIIDLKTGKQPIHNEDETIWIVYNGEVYNFQELRKDLKEKGHKFYTETDTETLVHAYEEYGDSFVRHLRGMFSFALWDSKKRRLILARDRMGIKPLYYSFQDDVLIFGSEIKCLLRSGYLKPEMNRKALFRFMMLRYIPGDMTIIKGVNKLPPGHMLVYEKGKISTRGYWDLNIIEDNKEPITFHLDGLRDQLSDSIRLRLISDVPLGAFLSGGIDSSIIVGIMSQFMEEPVRTFSVGFDIEEYSELKYARIVAEHFDTDHNEIIITPEKFIKKLPEIVWYMDEPIGDPTIIPTYFVSELARKKVKVVLSGEGGDEMFAGYPRYTAAAKREKFAGYYMRIPGAGKQIIKSLLSTTKYPPHIEALEKTGRYYLSIYARNFPEDIVKRDELNQDILNLFYPYIGKYKNVINEMMHGDIKTWLPEDLLMKVDKMSMAHSLEVRVPYLDHLLAEFSMRIPMKFKIKNNTVEKYILKRAYMDMLPTVIRERKKQGFTVPIIKWRNFLMDYSAEDILKSEFLNEYLGKGYIQGVINSKTRANELFYLVILNTWQKKFLSDEIVSV